MRTVELSLKAADAERTLGSSWSVPQSNGLTVGELSQIHWLRGHTRRQLFGTVKKGTF
jgi:hypothetical protein